MAVARTTPARNDERKDQSHEMAVLECASEGGSPLGGITGDSPRRPQASSSFKISQTTTPAHPFSSALYNVADRDISSIVQSSCDMEPFSTSAALTVADTTDTKPIPINSTVASSCPVSSLRFQDNSHADVPFLSVCSVSPVCIL